MEPRPKLRPDLEATSLHESDGDEKVVLRDPVTERYFRLSRWEHEFLKIFDGTLTAEEAIDRLKLKGCYYTSQDAQLILGKAAQAGLLLGSGYGTAKFQTELAARISRARSSRRLASIYFTFIPLFNPDSFLERTLWIYGLVANKWSVSMLALLTPGAIYIALSALTSTEQTFLYFFNIHNLLYLWFTLALTTLFHEFAHAYRAKSYGLRVPQMGVAFLIFFPCLYCDTTQAWRLADRKQRIAISGAGLVAEAALAIIASYMWYFSRPGLLNSLAFYLMAVSFFSTVAFNANPLMRYDGYYILSDYLGITNLASKSLAYIKFLFLNRVLGIESVNNPSNTRRETWIFSIYGISAIFYRVFLYFAIVLGVYFRFNKLVGFLLALLGLVALVALPLARGLSNLYARRSEMRLRPKAAAILFAMVLLGVIGLTRPISGSTVYPCYLDSAITQKITVPLQAPISGMFIRDGQFIEKKTPMFELDPTFLNFSLFTKRVDYLVSKTRVDLLLLDDKEMSKAAEKQVECEQLEHEIKLLENDSSLAVSGILSTLRGLVTGLDYRAQKGYQPGKGAVIGELKTSQNTVVRVLVPESERARIFQGQTAYVWFPVGSGMMRKEKVESIKPYSEKDIRNSPFSSRFGGEIATEAKTENHRDAPLDAQYIGEIPFENTDGLPIGLTGRCAVQSPPSSLLGRLFSAAVKIFNQETLL